MTLAMGKRFEDIKDIKLEDDRLYAEGNVSDRLAGFKCDSLVETKAEVKEEFEEDPLNIIPKEEIKDELEEKSPKKSRRRNKEKKVYMCPTCGQTFLHSGVLKIHIRKHTGEKPYVCDVCSKAFADAGDLRKHYRIHTGEKPYQCAICSRTFSQRGNLQKHVNAHLDKREYECPICKKRFIDKSTLKKHTATHTGVKPFQCDVCHRMFSQRGALNFHRKTHFGLRKSPSCSYQCTDCGRTFKECSNFRRHMFTHTGYKPYECEICHTRFTQHTNLKNHRKTHTRVHVCSICSDKFNSSEDLKAHKLSHKGTRCFACDMCGRRFTIRTKMNKHRKMHFPEQQNENTPDGKVLELTTNTKRNRIKRDFKTVNVPSMMYPIITAVNTVLPSQNPCSLLGNPAGPVDHHLPVRFSRMVQGNYLPQLPPPCPPPHAEYNGAVSPCDRSFSPDPLPSYAPMLETHMSTSYRNEIKVESKDLIAPVTQMFKNQHVSYEMQNRPSEADSRQSYCHYTHVTVAPKMEFAPSDVKPSFPAASCFASMGNMEPLSVSNLRKPAVKERIVRKSKTKISSVDKKDRTFICLICKQTFKHNNSLKIHSRIHTGEKPFPCSVCDKKFIAEGDLKKHLRTHTGEQPYQCPMCNKKFSQRGNLRKHSKTHEGEKLYSCSQCGKKFSESGNMKRHARTHSGEKPFECAECSRKFIERSDLEKHMTTHTSLKLFQCEICDKKFGMKGRMNHHRKSCRGECGGKYPPLESIALVLVDSIED